MPWDISPLQVLESCLGGGYTGVCAAVSLGVSSMHLHTRKGCRLNTLSATLCPECLGLASVLCTETGALQSCMGIERGRLALNAVHRGRGNPVQERGVPGPQHKRKGPARAQCRGTNESREA